MLKNFVKFINHASIIISNGNKSILTDPWYSGTSFDDGWKLLYENETDDIINILNDVNYIWFSHEHPDHFSIKFFKDYEKILKANNIKFLFQKTKDKRVVNFLKIKKFDYIELDDNEKYLIDKNFEVRIQKCDFYDSALIVKINDKKIFNINDCPLKTKLQIDNFKKRYGECDFLFTQFSYAAWKGGRKNINWRKDAAEEKIRSLKLQSEILSSKFTVPFASFIKFSDTFNSYLNDSVNSPSIVVEKTKDIKSNILFLKPYQVLDLDNPKMQNQGFEFWKKIYDDKNNFKIISNKRIYNFKMLEEEFYSYRKRIFLNNSKSLIKLISRLKFLNFFQPVVFKLQDLNINIKVDLVNDIFEQVNNDPEIEMCSRSLYLIFKQDFGFDTLTVNGCFEEIAKNSFTKISKTFAIGNLNNLGIKLNYKIIFNFSVIILFLKKLLFIKKKMA